MANIGGALFWFSTFFICDFFSLYKGEKVAQKEKLKRITYRYKKAAPGEPSINLFVSS